MPHHTSSGFEFLQTSEYENHQDFSETLKTYSSYLPNQENALKRLGQYRSTYEFGKNVSSYLPYGNYINAGLNISEAAIGTYLGE